MKKGLLHTAGLLLVGVLVVGVIWIVSSRKAYTSEVFPTTVDYRQSLGNMIKAGKYNYTNDDWIVAKNFPIEGSGLPAGQAGTIEFELVLVHFSRGIDGSDDAIKEMTQMGLESARIEHLLAFGATYPDVQRKYPIVCLGSSMVPRVGRRHVLVLLGSDENGGGRHLVLLPLPNWADGFHARCRFLAVRKKK